MGTLKASSIIGKAASQMHDPNMVRVAQTERLAHLCGGQRAIVAIRPNAYTRSLAVKLAAGTVQQIPADGTRLIDITHNMGTDGGTPGGAVTIVSLDDLNAYRPSWRSETAQDFTTHFMFNSKAPLEFQVTPPSKGNHSVWMTYSALPGDIGLDDAILLDDMYEEPLILWQLYKAFEKDATNSTSAHNSALSYLSAFSSFFGQQSVNDTKVDPNREKPAPPAPQVQGS